MTWSQTIPSAEDVRLAVYRGFAEHGRAESPADLARLLGTSDKCVRVRLHELARQRHVVLSDDDTILMAHPFASIALGFSVMGRHTLWWGGCAWDSFALPHLVTDVPDVLVATRCPACDRPHAWVVGREAPPPGDQVVHFLVPTSHIWDDVVHTCKHQRIFCDEACVASWLRASGCERGYVMSLATLWRLASHWYDGRLDPGYRRRDASTAAEYFREVGLHGPFWGL
jgi:Alkylmercury lyase